MTMRPPSPARDRPRSARAWSCPSPTRRRGPTASPPATSRVTSRSACTGRPRPALAGERLHQAVDGQHRGLLGGRCPGRVDRSRRGARSPQLVAQLVDAEAGRPAPWRDLGERRDCRRGSAARPTGSVRRRRSPVPRRRRAERTRDRRQPAHRSVERWLGQQQPQGVRVQRLGVDRSRVADLDDPAGVQARRCGARRERDPQVVGDQDQAPSPRLLQRLQQREDLLLGGHVERRGRLVGDQDLGVAGQRRGDRDALAHAARELERVALGGAVVVDPHLREPPTRCRAPFAARQADAACPSRLLDLVAAAPQRVQHGERVLQDERDPRAPQAGAPALAQGEHVVVAHEHAARRVDAAREQPDQRPCGHRLAAAGLADDRDCLARSDVEIDPRDDLLADPVDSLQIRSSRAISAVPPVSVPALGRRATRTASRRSGSWRRR